MSVDLLREAAKTMRARAQAVEQGRWIAEIGDSGQAWINLPAYPHAWGMHGFFEEAEHTAPFASPAVALAVADWLDFTAERVALAGALRLPYGAAASRAVAVARAYLGRDER